MWTVCCMHGLLMLEQNSAWVFAPTGWSFTWFRPSVQTKNEFLNWSVFCCLDCETLWIVHCWPVYDAARNTVCEMSGIYMLSILKQLFLKKWSYRAAQLVLTYQLFGTEAEGIVSIIYVLKRKSFCLCFVDVRLWSWEQTWDNPF